jgi:hypothetical protein
MISSRVHCFPVTYSSASQKTQQRYGYYELQNEAQTHLDSSKPRTVNVLSTSAGAGKVKAVLFLRNKDLFH